MDPEQQDQLAPGPEAPEAPVFVPSPPPRGLGLARSLLLALMVAVGLLEALLLSGLLLSSIGGLPAAPGQAVQASQASPQGQLPLV